MTVNDAIHWDVAAYALGVLDERDGALFEDHLVGCPECAAELEALLPTVELMSEVDIETLHAAEQSRVGERLFLAVAAERGRQRRRRAFTLAASVTATALAAGGALAAGPAWLGDDTGTPAVAPPATAPRSPAPSETAPGIGGPDLGDGQLFSATDGDTGVQAIVVLQESAWGTRVSFALSALPGPLTCRLVVVHGDGTAEVVGTWRVPGEGYGTAAQPDPLLLQTATAASQDEIDRIQVQSIDDTGEIATLVTVPVT